MVPAVFGCGEHEAGEGGEDAGETADAQEASLVFGGDEAGRLGQQPGEQREEQDQGDHPEHEPDRGAGGADLQQLGFELALHDCCSEVSSRKTSSSEELSAISSWMGTWAANAMSPTRSLEVPCASRACSLLDVVSMPPASELR
jgi:hypothetical protein